MEDAELLMEEPVKRFWDRIKIPPEKWQLPPLGDEGGGFWVVAVVGQKCVWYNDIEEGFNISRASQFGQISRYSCNQTDLLIIISNYHHDFLKAIASEA
ncbi:MAG: hypothetical protein JO250_12520 [Armatimonadetes bacterium]|nr:hypothetical protein [Armatimonadota bacterium]